jgi:hypothetical protein
MRHSETGRYTITPGIPDGLNVYYHDAEAHVVLLCKTIYDLLDHLAGKQLHGENVSDSAERIADWTEQLLTIIQEAFSEPDMNLLGSNEYNPEWWKQHVIPVINGINHINGTVLELYPTVVLTSKLQELIAHQYPDAFNS